MPTVLSYSLINPPSGAAIDANGIITWTPRPANPPGQLAITTVVTDNGLPPLSATNSFVVSVTTDVVQNRLTLPVQTNLTVAELTTLTVTNTASDPDRPTATLTYSLVDPPAGLAITTNGVITWTPSEAQGPGTNTITTIVTDSGVPPLSATNSFTVVVNEINSPPVLPVQTDRTLAGLQTLIVTNTATDSDLPVNPLTYAFQAAPTGASLDANGVITWTPTLAQMPSTNVFTTVVTDYNPWAVNNQNLTATNSFRVVVNTIHNGPSLPNQPNLTLAGLTTLIVTNTAIDTDVPALTLTYGFAAQASQAR